MKLRNRNFEKIPSISFALVAGYWLPIRKNEVPPVDKDGTKKTAIKIQFLFLIAVANYEN
nr:MAG TPA: hypothetical protein [Caudoviricetes sp.]